MKDPPGRVRRQRSTQEWKQLTSSCAATFPPQTWVIQGQSTIATNACDPMRSQEPIATSHVVTWKDAILLSVENPPRMGGGGIPLEERR